MEDKEAKKKKSNSLKSILGGDILATDFFRRQTKLLVLIMVLIIFYIHNRYASQQQQIEIDKLKKELIDIKYDALTRSSELMEKSRQSRIEDYISGTIMISGIQMLAKTGFSQRNVTIAALSLAVGIGFTSTSEVEIWNIFPQIVKDVFSANCVAVVFVVAIILSLILPKNMEIEKISG